MVHADDRVEGRLQHGVFARLVVVPRGLRALVLGDLLLELELFGARFERAGLGLASRGPHPAAEADDDEAGDEIRGQPGNAASSLQRQGRMRFSFDEHHVLAM